MSLTTKLDRTTETAIKGLAVIMMVNLHFFGFPEWLLSGIQYPFTGDFLNDSISTWIRIILASSISMYAFLTGWNYNHTKTPTLSYSLRKIKAFLKYYWFHVLVIFYPITILLGYTPSFKHLFLDLFAINIRGQNLVMFAWYVYFYVLVMLTLPYIIKIFTGKKRIDFLFPVLVMILNIIIDKYIQGMPLNFVITDYLNYLPTVLMGYLFAKHDIFGYLDKYLFRNPIVHVLNIVFLLFARKLLTNLTFTLITSTELSMDWLLVPFIIYSLVNLFSLIKGKLLSLFVFMGEHSLNIWFLHSLFFQVYTKQLLQPLVYLPSNPILVIIFAFCLLLPVSMGINYCVKRLPI